MRLSQSFAIFLFLLFSSAHAAQVKSFSCLRMSGEARCKIFLEGVVSERDLLFISRVEDRDELLFENQVIGNTGNILGRTFHAGFFPRVYSLSAIAGRKDAVLSIHAWGNLGKSAGIPSRAKVKMIDDHYPLWKILGPGALQILSFLFLGWIGLFAAAGSRERITDGWIYSPDDMRTLLGGLAIFLILRHEVSGLFVPLIWSSETHLFSQQVALFAMLWAANQLLLGGRFFDRSSIEQPRSKFPARWLPRIAHLALILSLGTLASFRALSEREQALLLAVPLVPLMLAQIKALMDLEWRKAVKRSAPSPFLFHLSLLALPYAVISTAASAWFSYGGDLGWLDFSGWAILLLAGLRRRSQNRIREMARILAADCRMKMLEHHSAGFRLRIFTEFVAEDWGAARVSVLSINQDTGLVLFSAGPDALPEGNRFTPQKLGPFLRRACKRGRMLYAPVAEELGQDLQSQGLKHSSLTIPISQENQVRAVICMMADEGERIPPQDANLLEDFVDLLSLEILSAAEQTVSDQRTLQLMNIARTADALAVENLDHWGHMQSSEENSRLVLGGDSVPAGPFFDQLKRSRLLGKIWQSYRNEVRNQWSSTAGIFEFIPKDKRDDFWLISPRSFHNPYLQALGAERVAVLLGALLEKQARSIAQKQAYGVLGYCGARIACGNIKLRHSLWHDSSVEVDGEDFSKLVELRFRAHPGTILFYGASEALSSVEQTSFRCSSILLEQKDQREIHSILSVSADKKEMRRLENLALEKARTTLRKAA